MQRLQKKRPTALLNNVQARMGDVMVLEFLALLEGAYQDGVILRRDKRDCVETEWWRHSSKWLPSGRN